VSQPLSAPARLRLPGLRAPRPLLSPDGESRLTPRQRDVLDALEQSLGRESLAERTMAELAGRLGCSLRTLYGIARSRDELLLLLVDRRLHRIGRRAMAALDPGLAPLEAVRRYLRAAHEAVQPAAAAFAREFAGVAGARRLLDSHEAYVVAVTQALLERARASGEILPTDTAAVAHVLGGLGREFARPEVAVIAAAPPRETADALVDVVLRGLAPQPARRRRPASSRSRRKA